MSINTYAVIQNGIVENLVDWDGVSDWQPPQGMQAVELAVGQYASIGYTYANGEFSAPA